MNYKLISEGAGGIFSEFMDIFIMNAIKLHGINNLYLELNPRSQLKAGKRCFNFVLDQSCDRTYKKRLCRFKSGFRIKGKGMGLIEESPLLKKVKKVLGRIRIKKTITNKVNELHLITEKTLGVHVRGVDMNKTHPKYGVFTLDDYINRIKLILNNYDIDNVFVAADNHESLSILSSVFGNITSYPSAIRGKTKEENTWQVQFDNANNEEFWKEAFIDMLLLSKCKHLLCRMSNLSNASIAYSNTLTNIHRL